MEEFPKTCFPLEIFINPDVVEEFKCTIGENILNNPVMDKEGKSYCLACYHNHHLTDSVNPDCSKEYLTPILIVKNCIEKAHVKCLNFNRGCEFVSLLKNIKDHFDNECLFKLKKCKYSLCSYMTQNRSITDHEEICEFKENYCEFCKELVPAIKAEEHEKNCEFKEFPCEENCGQLVKKKDIETHRKIKCENSEFKCSFGFLGCDFNGKRAEYIQHFELHFMFDSGAHIDHVKQQLKEKAETIYTIQKEKSKLIDEYELNVKKLEGIIKDRDFEIKKSEENIQNLMMNIEQKSNKIVEINEKLKKLLELNENFKQEINQCGVVIKSKDDEIEHLKQKNIELNQELMIKKELINNLEKTIVLKNQEIEKKEQIINNFRLEINTKVNNKINNKYDKYKPFIIVKTDSNPIFYTNDGSEPNETSSFILNDILLFDFEQISNYKLLYHENLPNENNLFNNNLINTLGNNNYIKENSVLTNKINITNTLKVHKLSFSCGHSFYEKKDFSINYSLNSTNDKCLNLYMIGDMDIDNFGNIYTVDGRTCSLRKYDKSFNLIQQLQFSEEIFSEGNLFPSIVVSKTSEISDTRILLTYNDNPLKEEKNKWIIKCQMFDNNLTPLRSVQKLNKGFEFHSEAIDSQSNNAVVAYSWNGYSAYLQFIKPNGKLGKSLNLMENSDKENSVYGVHVGISKKSKYGLISWESYDKKVVNLKRFDMLNQIFLDEEPLIIPMDISYNRDNHMIGINANNHIMLVGTNDKSKKLVLKFFDFNIDLIEEYSIDSKIIQFDYFRKRHQEIIVLDNGFLISDVAPDEFGYFRHFVFDKNCNLIKTNRCKAVNNFIRANDKKEVFIFNDNEISLLKNYL